MATTRPIPSSKAETKATSESVDSARNANASVKSTQQPPAKVGAKSVNLDVLRKDIAKVEVADTDFVLTTNSGRKILIRDGAFNAVTDEEFSVVFSDEESVPAKVLFNESQNTAIDNAPLNWSDGSTEAAALVVPAVASASGISYSTLGIAAAVAAAAGGGGGGGGSPTPSPAPNPPQPDDTADARKALDIIVQYAQNNGGQQPSAGTYMLAGVKTPSNAKISDQEAAAFNDALLTPYVTGDSVNTVAELQALVDAYRKVFALAADDLSNTVHDALDLSQNEYERIGADITQLKKSTLRLSLLNDIVHGQNFDGVNTIKEINKLIEIANAIQDKATGEQTDYVLKVDDFKLIKIRGIAEKNLGLLLSAIEKAGVEGEAKAANVNSVSEIQNLLFKSLVENFTFDAIQSDSGYSSSDFITNDKELTFSGKSKALEGTRISITLHKEGSNQDLVFEGKVDSLGNWQAGNGAPLEDGKYKLTLQMYDGQQPEALLFKNAFTQPVEIDNQYDSELDQFDIRIEAIDSKEGGRDTDFITTQTKLKYVGRSTAENGTKVAVEVDGVMYFGAEVQNNKWTLDNTGNPLSLNKHTVKAYLVDEAGNYDPKKFDEKTVEIQSSEISLVDKTENAISVSSNLELIFSVAVKAVAGKKIRIFDTTNNSVFEDIDAGTSKVKIDPLNDHKVIIDPSGIFVREHSYKATIEEGAFESEAGVKFAALLGDQWTFRAVDPSTTVSFAGLSQQSFDALDGINALELGVNGNNLVIKGEISSVELANVSNARITKITFSRTNTTNSNAPNSFALSEIGQDGTNVKGVTWSQDGKSWTLANDASWASQLISGEKYTITVDLGAKIGTKQFDSVGIFQSAAVLIDKDPPALISITWDEKNKILSKGGVATFDFVFSEDPVDSFTKDDLVIAQFNGNDVARILSITGGGKTRTVVLQANDNVSFNSATDNASIFKIKSGSFKDAAGNISQSVSSDFNYPPLTIDTLGPIVNKVEISGVLTKENGAESFNAILGEGDKIRVKVTMSEEVLVTGVPTFTLVVGSAKPQAKYVSGSGSKVLVFEYTVGITDKDTSGGVTAEANSLSFGTGRITDNLYNMAQTVDPAQNVVKTLSVDANTNQLIVDAGANGSALAKIKKFADDNTKPFEADYIGEQPTVDDYSSAGVDIVDKDNYKSINNALATSTVTGASINDLNALKQLVSAYIRILDLAGGGDNNLTPSNPEALQYTLIGVQGVDSYVASLLGDVIDIIEKKDVATVPQIQDRANAAKAVMLLTRNITGLTLDQLTNQLKIEGVTKDNFSAVSHAIMDATGNEDAVNTWKELQDLVKNAADKATQAFEALKKFANDNADSLPVNSSDGQYIGVKPSLEIYKAAGIAGEPDVSDERWVALVNDALATAPIVSDNIDTFDMLQTLVTAAIGIVKLANNNGDTTLDKLSKAAAYKNLGVGLFQDDGLTLADPKAQLLSDIIDRKDFLDVNTIKKIQALAQATSAVIDKAAGIGRVTTDHLKLLGFNVDESIVTKINSAIDNTLNNGTEVDTYIELSKLIADNLGEAGAAILQIANFADQNSKSKPTPLADFKYNTSNDIDEPTIGTYKKAGIVGASGGDVTEAEANAFNDALATANVVFTSVNTQEKIQKLADAYIAVLKIANGSAVDTGPKPTLEQYGLLGVTDLDVVTQIADANVKTAVVQARVNLLGDVIAHKTNADVDTVLEIQNFANIASRVMYQANGLDGLSVDDLNKLGVDIVTADNFAVVRKAIVNTPDTGDKVDSIQELQDLLKPFVEKFNKALDKIKQYADAREDPTNLGTASEQPTVQDYLDLGIDTVNESNLVSMNSALATKSVKSTQVSDAKSVRELVNAYLEVLAAANKNQGDVIQEKDYTLLGVAGIVGDKYKVNLLNDVIDYKKDKTEIDTADELQALADIVNAVMNTAASKPGGLNSIEQFKALGVTGVVSANLGKVLSAIEVTLNDGSEVDTVFKIQKLVNQELGLQATALAAIAKFADDNSQSKPLNGSNFQYQGDRPTRLIYSAAGIQGDVTEADADSFNDALATLSVKASSVINPDDPNDASKLQKLVNAYRKFFALADADVANVLTATQNPLTADDCNLLGISPVPTGSSNGPRLQLLTDIVDRQKRGDVATIAQINRLATITIAIQDKADGKTLSQELKSEDFALIGVKGVTSTNLGAFLTAIEATVADKADSVPELQSLLFDGLSVDFTGINPDTGAIEGDFITKARSLTFSGESNAADNTKIKLILKREGQNDITIDGGVVRNGLWSIADGRQLDEGTYKVTAQLQLADGTPVSKDFSFDKPVVIDFSSDDRTGKTIEITEISPDSGTQDFRTSATNLIFKGKATAAEGSYVALTLDGELKYSSVVGADGLWSVDFRSKTLSKGDYKVIASLTDAAGNPIISSKEETIKIDTAAKLSWEILTKDAIASTSQLKLLFDAPIEAQPNKYIYLIDESPTGKTIKIPVNDSQISINNSSSGSEFTIKLSPENALVLNRNYSVTIDEGAFVSTSGATFDGLLGDNWSFYTADPSTTINWGGAAVNANNGINAEELGALSIFGQATSLSWRDVHDAKVTKLIFTSTDSTKTFTINTDLRISSDGTWSVGADQIDKSKFESGSKYTVQATITSTINSVNLTADFSNNTPVLVDKVGPELKITTDNLTKLALNEWSIFTFKFNEAPADFELADIKVGTTIVNNNRVSLGSLSDFNKINETEFTVKFTANTPDINLEKAGLFSVAKDAYQDAVGNYGIESKSSPVLYLETRAPRISAIRIIGLDSNNNTKTVALGFGDKIRINLFMSETTELIANGAQTPGFTIDIGGVKKTATFVASSNNTGTLQFEYTIGFGDNDRVDGITADKDSLVNVASLRDEFGNITAPNSDEVAAKSNTIIVDTRIATAINLISSFAQENVISSDKQNPTEFTYKVSQSGRKPILQDYTDANVTDVTDKNIDAINDALATAGVGLANTNSVSGIQKVVSAYNAVFALANATSVNGATTNPVDTPPVPALRVSQFADIGADIGGMTDGSINLRLLNSVLDFKLSTEVDTVKEINLLAAVTNAILEKTNNGNAASAALLTKENLIKLGLGTLGSASASDIAGVLESIAAQRDGTNIDTQGRLQSLVNFYMLQPLPSIGLKTDSGINTTDLKSNDSSLNFTEAFGTAGGTSIVVSLEERGSYGSIADYNNLLKPQTSGIYTVWARLVNDQGFLGRRQSFTFTLDVNGPQAIKLNTNATNSNTEDVAYGGTSFGQSKLIAPNIHSVTDDDIAVITLKISNFSAATDKVTYRSSGTFSAFTLVDGQTQSVTIDGVPIGVNVKYTANSNTFEFSTDAARTSRVFTAAEVQIIERALGFSTTDTNGNVRKFEFNHTDVVGNSNAVTGAATVTMSIDNLAPNKVLFASDLGDRQLETGFYNKSANSAGLPVAIAANIKPTTDTDIAKIQLTIGVKAELAAADFVLFGDNPNNAVTLNLATPSGRGSGITIGGVSGVDWEYIVNSTSRTLTFSLTNKAAFRQQDVALLESNLFFKSVSIPNIDTQAERKFTFDHIDMVGLSTQTSNNGATKTISVDYNATKAVDLDGTNAVGVIDTATLQYFNKSTANGLSKAVTIAPKMALLADNDIASFSVKLSGVGFDFDNDKIFINDFIDLNSGPKSGMNLPVAGVSGVTWQYSVADRSFTFKKANGSNFDAADVQTIEQALIFTTRGINSKQGERAFTFTHFDQAGNDSTSATATVKLDTLGPGDIDLNGSTDVTDAETKQYFNQSVLASSTQSVLIAANIKKPVDNDIAIISVTVGGANFDPAGDKFVINDIEYALTADLPATNLTIAGLSGSGVTFSYANKTITFKKSNGDSFDAADVQKIEKAIGFKTNATTQGERTFTFIHTDQAGNTSNSATATIQVDTRAPEPIDLDDGTADVENERVRTMNIKTVDSGVQVADRIKKASIDEGVVKIHVSMLNSEMISEGDKLVFGSGSGSGSVAFGREEDASHNGQPMTIGIATGVSWLYSAADKTLTFRKANNTAFSAAEVQSIEKELYFKTTTDATAGDRLFTFTHSDLAGNISPSATVRFATDVKASVINLDGTAVNYSVTTTAALTSAVKIAAPNASVAEEDRIASFQIRVQGQRASNSERFVIGSTEIDASGSVSSVSVTLAATGGRANGSTWNWNYNPASGAFVFAATVGGHGVTAEQAAAFLTSLSYKATTANPGDDVRKFYISATDYVGNKSATESVSTVLISNAPPAKHPTISTALLDTNADRYIGDKFVLTFSEAVDVSSFLPTASNPKWTISSGSLGEGWTARAVDIIKVNGTDYATNFLVTTGTGANIVAGQAQTLTLTGQSGGSGNYSMQAGVVLPTFTLTSQAVTLEAWVFADYASWGATGNQKFQRIFDFGTVGNIPQGGSPGTEIWLGFDNTAGKLAFEYINSGSGEARNPRGKVVANALMPLKTWQHVAVTFGPKPQSSAATATLYMNGVLVNETTVTSANSVDFNIPLPSSVTFTNNLIGKSNWQEDAGFNGRIYDARVYSNVRTAQEIFNDYKGWIDTSDRNMILQYDFNGNANNGAIGTAGATNIASNRNGSILNNTTFAAGGGTTISVKSDNVVDTARVNAGTQVEFQLYKKSATVGGLGNDTIGSLVSDDFKGNNFIAGQGGNDTVTGGSGSDTFAWFSGETGSDTVTDFKVPEGDMIDLSGIFANRTMSNLNLFLQLQMLSNNDAVLKIDISGTGNFASPTKTITFTAGALNGLDNTLAKLVENKVINLTNQDQTPLMLDLDGDGVHTSSLADGVKFDIEGAGQKTFTGWSDGKDGFLVLDLDSDGTINNGTELFGNSTKLADGQTKAKDGFEALRQYDLNQDNLIDANDAVFANLKIWVDANKDGVSQSEELHGLQDIGLRALKLNAEAGHTLDNGNVLSLVSTWVDNRGQEHAFVDVTFATSWQSQANHAVM